MITLRPLPPLTLAEVASVATPYTAEAKYVVAWSNSPERVTFDLTLVPLSAPVERRYDHFDEETLAGYNATLPNDFSFGAYEEERLVGLLIAHAERWNNSLWVSEFHVAGAQRGKGIGRQLMERAAEAAGLAHLRVIVCETQNANASAIQAYRALGFHLEGIDISYYTNSDYPERDVAVFMKRRIL